MLKAKVLIVLFILVAAMAASSQTRVPGNAVRVMVKFENNREQYAVKVDTAFYWVRYARLVPIKKPVKSYRLLSNEK